MPLGAFRLDRFESVIHEKGARNHPLSDALVNGRYRIYLLCRLIGGFFMSAEALQSACYSSCQGVCALLFKVPITQSAERKDRISSRRKVDMLMWPNIGETAYLVGTT
jgi:hypothetical protein